MFVSVSGENNSSGNSNINTLTATWRGVCLYDFGPDTHYRAGGGSYFGNVRLGDTQTDTENG